MSDSIRVGVVGVGYWGIKHVRALEKVNGVSAVAAIDERLAGLRCRFRLMASLELLTIVGTDARVPPFRQGEKAVWIKCHSKVSRKPRAVQLHR